MKRRFPWFVQVSYSDDTMDVVGSSSYVKARAMFDQFAGVAGDEPEGVLSVEMIDTQGRLVASTGVISCGDRTAIVPPGHHVWSEAVHAYVPARFQPA